MIRLFFSTGRDNYVGNVFLGCVAEVGERTPRVWIVVVEVIGVQRRVLWEFGFKIVHRVLYDIVVVFVRTDEGRRTDQRRTSNVLPNHTESWDGTHLKRA